MAIDIEASYTRYAPMVLRRCKRILGEHDAQAVDAMQEVFVLLLRHRGALQDSHLSSLLYTMATRVCLNIVRRRSRRPEVPDGDLVQRLACIPNAEPLWARLALRALWQHFPPSTAMLAVRHWLDGLTLEEVAREAGMSVSGVRKRLRGLRETVAALEEVAP